MKATHVSPLDEIQMEVAALSNDELFARQKAYSNLNSATASDRMLEMSLALDAEAARRLNSVRGLVEG